MAIWEDERHCNGRGSLRKTNGTEYDLGVLYKCMKTKLALFIITMLWLFLKLENKWISPLSHFTKCKWKGLLVWEKKPRNFLVASGISDIETYRR